MSVDQQQPQQQQHPTPRYTPHGFRVFDVFLMSTDKRILKVVQSRVMSTPHAWVSWDRGQSCDLSVADVKRLIAALGTFVESAEAGELTTFSPDLGDNENG